MEVFNSHPHFQFIIKIYQQIKAAGFEVYLAGGCVRDGILGVLPNDFDLAVSAKPEQIEKLFKKTIDIGKKFGTIIVVDEENKKMQVEVTSFRKDGNYNDGRRPDSVQFSTAKEDALRRDFTINALFYDLDKKEIIDFVGGVDDIQKKIIRAVGDPKKRFSEDHLRIIRALRFVSQLGFKLDENTRTAISEQAHTLNTVSQERIFNELDKLIRARYRTKALQELASLKLSYTLFHLQDFNPEPWFNENEFSTDMSWFFFWNCCLDQKNDFDADDWMKELRFSKNLRQKLVHMLFWRLKGNFEKEELGQLIEIFFNPGLRKAVEILVKLKKVDSKKWEKIKNRIDFYQSQSPPFIVKAKDLVAYLRGASLGQAVKQCRNWQLTGEISHQSEAFDRLRREGIIK